MMKITRKPNEVPASLKSINIEAILRKRGVYLQKRMNHEMKQAALPLARQMLANKKRVEPPRHNQFTNDVVMSYWEKQIHVVEVAEKHFENKLKQYITKIGDAFLAHLDSEIATNKKFDHAKFKDYFDDNEDELLAVAQLDFTPILESVATLSGQEALKLIRSNDVYMPFKYRETIRENVDKFAKSLIDTDKQILSDIVANGLDEGESVAEIRRKITDTFPEYTKNQAQRITRTEVLRTSNQSSLDAWEQSGVVEGKQWLTAGATDECAQYEGQIESLSGNFYSGTSEFADGDPPLHPNCRCVVLPVLVDEKSYKPQINKKLYERIKELESQIDKRTKDFRQLKQLRSNDEVYIKSLEKYLGVSDE